MRSPPERLAAASSQRTRSPVRHLLSGALLSGALLSGTSFAALSGEWLPRARWRRRLLSQGCGILCGSMCCFALAELVRASSLGALNVRSTDDRTEVRLQLPATVKHEAYLRSTPESAQTSTMAHLVLRLHPFTLAHKLARTHWVQDGLLHSISFLRQSRTEARVVFTLKDLERFRVRSGQENSLIVELFPRAAAPRPFGMPPAQPPPKAAESTNPARSPAAKLVPPQPAAAKQASTPRGSKRAPLRYPPLRARMSQKSPQSLLVPPSAAKLDDPHPLHLPPLRTLVIDPGHGGRDPGAVAFGLREKEVALRLARMLAADLRRSYPQLRVRLTRTEDQFLPLEVRPRIARAYGADLFLSIHLNAHRSAYSQGIETYFFHPHADAQGLATAKRENGPLTQGMQAILADLRSDSLLSASVQYAHALQEGLVQALRPVHPRLRDLGVKQAPFVVLAAAEIPSVLVELGFLTHAGENLRLRSSAYLQRVVVGLRKSLRSFIEQPF